MASIRQQIYMKTRRALLLRGNRILLLFTIGIPAVILFLVLLGRFYIFNHNKFLTIKISFLGANLLEISFLIAAFTLLTIYALSFLPRTSKKIALLLVILLIPFIFNAVVHGTQDGAVDEGNTIYEAGILKNTQLEAWRRSSYRITSVTMGTLFNLIDNRDYVASTDIRITQLGYYKAAHWFLAFIFIIGLHYVINKFFIRKLFDKNNFEALFFVLFIGASLLIPSNLMSMRYANYDAFSMLLGLIGLFLSLAGVNQTSWKYAYWGLIFSTLAAQEKLLASPFLIVSLMLSAYVMYQKKHKMYLVPLFVLIGMFISLITAAVLTLWVGLIRNFTFPDFSLFNLAAPLISWKIAYNLVVAPAKDLTLPIAEVSKYITALGAVLLIATIFLDIIKGLLNKINTKFNKIAVLACVLVVWIFGIFGTYKMKAYQPWIVPPSPGNFDARAVGNNFWFVDTETKNEQMFKNIAWYNAEFVNTVPTVVLVLLFIIVVFALLRREKGQTSINGFLDIAVMASLAFPTLLAIKSSWLYNRYYNAFTYLLCIYVLVNVITFLLPKIKSIKIQSAVVFIIILGFFIEIIPYRVAYGYFRPIWSQAGEYEKNNVETGRQFLAFSGWSLEHAATQSKIYEICKQEKNCSEVRIYSDYAGYWLGSAHSLSTWEVFNFNGDSYSIPQASVIGGYKNTDYFVLTRIGLYNALGFGNLRTMLVPKEVVPVFTIKVRGFIIAWVYRGDELKKQGFSF